jgi:predicted amidohydrolase
VHLYMARARVTRVRSPLAVAVAQPLCIAGDVSANAAAHADAIRRADARVVVFPELSLTGYELGAATVDPDGQALRPVIDACDAAGTVALVGAPVADAAGRRYIATLAVTGDGAEVAYRKVWLHGDEAVAFAPGPTPQAWEVDGWRLGLGICRDTGVAEHIDSTVALGIDLYVAGVVHHPDELAVQDDRGTRIARRAGVPVAFASAAGESGSMYPRTAGHSTVWSAEGTVIARAGATTGELACAILRSTTSPPQEASQ